MKFCERISLMESMSASRPWGFSARMSSIQAVRLVCVVLQLISSASSRVRMRRERRKSRWRSARILSHRILEFESQPEGSGDKTCEVELWDCSGDFKFETCWPAVMKDSSGVVIVFNPDVPSHLKEIETWHSMFISSQSLQDSQCLLVAHHKPRSEVEEGRLPLAPHLSRLPLLHSNLEEESEDVRKEFRRYLGNVVNALSESREREEMSIIM
ncbi:intraflagellar transport protein 22 homolog isoform X1 [Synchiropus splendidus]|uniref:intraflagellar transport protein 22 homolog isoform X1 n=1 Tax=Synchiropus splendidus TaxID=270530 RepID=UPI00237EC6E0|nr:intraflagellar transport protein 22 homolog isoform X1 [Synchiropus splendidus]